jgi:hypothetical protein
MALRRKRDFPKNTMGLQRKGTHKPSKTPQHVVYALEENISIGFF